MHAALAHAVMLVFAAAMARFGWFMAHAPERAVRFFSFGSEPVSGTRLVVLWSKVVGWLFVFGGCFGCALYLVVIPIDLLRSR